MATTDDSALFVDTNVLIYANVDSAPLHQAALSALSAAHDAGRTIWISRQVLREFAVVRSRPQSFARAAKPEIVVERLRYLEDAFQVADDTQVVTDILRQLMADTRLGGKQVHDANLVATMIAYGIPSLLTHNAKDFQRFGDRIRIETLATREKGN